MLEMSALVKGLHESYQTLLSASMGNGIINFAGEYIAKVLDQQLTTNRQIVYLMTFFFF